MNPDEHEEPTPTYTGIEDWDLYQSNAPKGFLELADDAYDRAKDN